VACSLLVRVTWGKQFIVHNHLHNSSELLSDSFQNEMEMIEEETALTSCCILTGVHTQIKEYGFMFLCGGATKQIPPVCDWMALIIVINQLYCNFREIV
jgi:hypothetical protein